VKRKIVPPYIAYGAVCFSPNSRYLYVIDTWYVHQFDTEAVDIQASRVVIAEKDNSNHFNYMPQGLYVWNLVLDNKIRQVGKLVKMD
jgi:sugar lactone lactonase YvrE